MSSLRLRCGMPPFPALVVQYSMKPSRFVPPTEVPGLAARRIAAEVASLTTTEACEEVIDREITALLGSMSQSLRADLNVDVDEAVQ